MADPVKARADVALQNPLGRALPAEQDKALCYGVGGGSFGSKPVGARVPRRLGHRTERQQVECLHRAVQHSRDTQGSEFGRVLLRDIHSPERLRACSPVAAGGVWPQSSGGAWSRFPRPRPAVLLPRFSVTRLTARALPLYEWVSRRCRARTLFHLPCLCCLHDTRLEAAHSSFGLFPVDLVPGIGPVGGCTRVFRLRHLLFLLSPDFQR